MSVAGVIPVATLLSHIVFVAIVLAYIFRNSWGKGVIEFIRSNGLLLGLLISIALVLGSLFYSEVLLFEPCVLCWWQRVLLYPTLVLFAVAVWKKDNGVFKYVLPLAVLAAVIALYQAYANLGGTSILDCTALGGACSKVFVKEFGYITIPTMSFTAAAYLILLSLINRRNA